MAQNLAIKYQSKIADIFTRESVIKGLFSAKMDFVGAETVRIYQLLTVPEQQYGSDPEHRYGKGNDVRDVVHEYKMTQKPSFKAILDDVVGKDQPIEEKTAEFIQRQLALVSTPRADKYAISRMAQVGAILPVASAPTKMTIVDLFADAQEHFTNANVPERNRVALVPAFVYKLLVLADLIVGNEALGKKAISKGEVGECFDFRVIKAPSNYFPNGVYTIFASTDSCALPYKIDKLKTFHDTENVAGDVVVGLQRYDFFVLAEKADAVLVAVNESMQQAAVTLAGDSDSGITATSAGAGAIYYTTDGSDPRLSMNRSVYTGSFDAEEGATVKAVAYAEGKFHSSIATLEVPKAS